MVSDEVADGGAGALQFGFTCQMDDQHVKFFVIGGRVCAEALESGEMGFEGIFDIGGVPLRRLRLVKLVQQVAAEFQELAAIKGLRKSFGDAGAGLLGVHDRAGCFLTR
jgi:hypothetical protein